MFAWFDTRNAKIFGETMARAFMAQMPVDSASTDKKFAKRGRKALDQIAAGAVTLKKSEKLNTFKIAQAGNTFKWALLDAGYDRAYVDELTAWLVGKLR